MTSVISASTSRTRSIDISSLSPEVLLSIFLKLDSEEIIIFRRTCKKWLDVIDTNKLLWRNLEWIGKSTESIEKAVEVFDQKSSSSLEMVSIEDDGAWDSKDLQQAVAVVSRSRSNLNSLSILTTQPSLIIGQLLELVNSSPKLEKLVLWYSDEDSKKHLPLARLVSSSERFNAGPSASRLTDLWLDLNLSVDIEEILPLSTQFIKSLTSFALFGLRTFQELRPLIAKFSEGIAHLRLSIRAGESQIEQPLFCPNLKILEGNIQPGVSLYFDCPNLKHQILWFGPGSVLQRTPSSVEQLWLKSNGQIFSNEVWKPLLSSCPRMEVLKLKITDPRRSTNLQPEALVQVLEKRQAMVKKGEEIQGRRVVSLQKLILPIEFLSKYQLERALEVVGEVIDIGDYPNFIELEY